MPKMNQDTPMAHETLKPKYRPDVDGLRAVAVAAVVLFHAFPDRVGAGFIGVDVFFVISGFLISTIIVEHLASGDFSFVEFYVRRVRRIFPALFVVLLACLTFGWIALLADEYKQLGKHTAAGAGFVSNFVLWSESGYFDNSGETKPLLHLWSLGVEEQFYIAWPLLLLFMWKKKGNLLIAVAAVAMMSFGLNLLMVVYDGVADFYSPLSRMWELLFGAWLAVFLLRRENEEIGVVARNFASLAGAGLMIYGFMHIDRYTLFPGVWALFPVMGTCLLLFAGPFAWFNRVVLANPLLVGLGLISYPLYLWHWPLLSFIHIVGGFNQGHHVKEVAIFAAVVLAWLTYKLIERPIRFGKSGTRPAIALVSLMACAGFAGLGIDVGNGLRSRTAVDANIVLTTSSMVGDEGRSLDACRLPAQERKLFGVCGDDIRGGIRYILLGDSKAQSLYPGLIRTSTDAGRWRIIGGNGPYGPLVPIISSEPEYEQYQRMAEIAIDQVSNDASIKAVAIAVSIRAIFQLDDGVKGRDFSSYNYRYLQSLSGSDKFEKAHAGLKKAISRLVMAGKKVVIMVDNPPLPAPRDCISRKTSIEFLNEALGLENSETRRNCFLPLAQFNEESALYRNLLSTLGSDFPGSLAVFDATDIYCDKVQEVCGPTRDNHLLYSYTDHVSDYAAGLVGAKLNAYLNESVQYSAGAGI